MLDVAATLGWLVSCISACHLQQMVVQGRWLQQSSLLTLPHLQQRHLQLFRSAPASARTPTLPDPPPSHLPCTGNGALPGGGARRGASAGQSRSCLS